MKKNLLIIILLVFITKYGTAQFIDKYGVNIGASYSSQLWDYKLISVDNPNKDYKIGVSAFCQQRKRLVKCLVFAQKLDTYKKDLKIM